MSVTLDGVATTKTPVYTPLQQKTILKRWEQTWSYIHQLVSWFGMLVFLMVWNCSWCSLKNESTGMEKITSQFVRVMCCSYCQTQLEVAVFTQDWSRAHRKFEAELEQEIFPWIFWPVDLASIKPWYQSYDLWDMSHIGGRYLTYFIVKYDQHERSSYGVVVQLERTVSEEVMLFDWEESKGYAESNCWP